MVGISLTVVGIGAYYWPCGLMAAGILIAVIGLLWKPITATKYGRYLRSFNDVLKHIIENPAEGNSQASENDIQC